MQVVNRALDVFSGRVPNHRNYPRVTFVLQEHVWPCGFSEQLAWQLLPVHNEVPCAERRPVIKLCCTTSQAVITRHMLVQRSEAVPYVNYYFVPPTQLGGQQGLLLFSARPLSRDLNARVSVVWVKWLLFVYQGEGRIPDSGGELPQPCQYVRQELPPATPRTSSLKFA